MAGDELFLGGVAEMPHEVWADCLAMSEGCAAAEEWDQFNTVLVVLAEVAPEGAGMAMWVSYAVAAIGADRVLELLRAAPGGESVGGLIMRLASQLPARDSEAVERVRQFHERMEARGVVEAAEDASETVAWLYEFNPALDSDERKRAATQRGDDE